MQSKNEILKQKIAENSSAYGLLTRYIHPNHQSSCTLETDENGDIITYEEYHPFGTTSYQATNASITVAAKRYRYTGMERDDETGLNYHNARYYINWLGRWLNCDPIGINDDVNVYAYCKNNPVGNTDVRGTQIDENPANKLPGFTPAKADPNISADNLRAAGTGGGAGATQMQNLKVVPANTEKPIVGHQYPKGTFEGKAADPTPRAAANNNTTGLAGDASNPAPTDAQLLQEAAEMLQSGPEIQIGKGLLSGSTSGDITANIQKNDGSKSGFLKYDPNKSDFLNLSVNVGSGEINKVGSRGVLASNESLEFGPYAVANSTDIQSRTNIQHDAALTPTAIVETSFVTQDRTAQLGGGISETKVTVIESKTLIPSGQSVPTRTVGEVKQKFVTGGLKYQGFDFQFKVPRN